MCSEYIYFGNETLWALPAIFALLDVQMLTSLGLMYSACPQNGIKNRTIIVLCQRTFHLQSRNGKIQTSKHIYGMKQTPGQKTKLTYTSWKSSL